jgi:23S rRNA pseudouridine1911/1915/1917 synthase
MALARGEFRVGRPTSMDLPKSAVPSVLKLSSPATKEYWEIPVLYSDKHLLALDKPAGLLTSPDRFDPERACLTRLLHAHISRGVPWAKELGLGYLANAHRLDSDTSGVMLFARSKDVLAKLANDFGADLPVRTHQILVNGSPAKSEFEVDAKLAPHPVRPGVMRVDPVQGKKSLTRFRALERFVGYTWMEAVPVTSRNQQVRAHLWWAKLPLVGDRVYAGKPLWLSEIKPAFRPRKDRPERALMARTAIHASVLELKHPMDGTPLRIESPVPRDLGIALKYLRRYASGVSLGLLRDGDESDSDSDSGSDSEP